MKPFAERIEKEIMIPTVAVGMITEATQAEQILQADQADIIAMAHQLMAQPGWPLQAARELAVNDPWSVHPHDYAHRLRRRNQLAQKIVAQAQDTTHPILERIIGTH